MCTCFVTIIKQRFAPLSGFGLCCSAHLLGVTYLPVWLPRCAALSTRCSHSKGKITANINMASYISGRNKPAFLTALTVTCGVKQIPKSLSERPHIDCLSQAHTHTHTHKGSCTETLESAEGPSWKRSVGLGGCTVKQKYQNVSPPAICWYQK